MNLSFSAKHLRKKHEIWLLPLKNSRCPYLSLKTPKRLLRPSSTSGSNGTPILGDADTRIRGLFDRLLQSLTNAGAQR